MRYVELRRHTDNDGDKLSEKGVADAEAIGKTGLHPPYAAFVSTGAAEELVRPAMRGFVGYYGFVVTFATAQAPDAYLDDPSHRPVADAIGAAAGGSSSSTSDPAWVSSPSPRERTSPPSRRT
jgi:hypothetical protein